MKKIEPEELYARLSQKTGKTPEEVEQSIEDLICHIWPLLAQEDRQAMSAGLYPTKEQFISYLARQTQFALEHSVIIEEWKQ